MQAAQAQQAKKVPTITAATYERIVKNPWRFRPF
jgi:hypothetical protein